MGLNICIAQVPKLWFILYTMSSLFLRPEINVGKKHLFNLNLNLNCVLLRFCIYRSSVIGTSVVTRIITVTFHSYKIILHKAILESTPTLTLYVKTQPLKNS